jgi:hypothetical protein
MNAMKDIIDLKSTNSAIQEYTSNCSNSCYYEKKTGENLDKMVVKPTFQ